MCNQNYNNTRFSQTFSQSYLSLRVNKYILMNQSQISLGGRVLALWGHFTDIREFHGHNCGQLPPAIEVIKNYENSIINVMGSGIIVLCFYPWHTFVEMGNVAYWFFNVYDRRSLVKIKLDCACVCSFHRFAPIYSGNIEQSSNLMSQGDMEW